MKKSLKSKAACLQDLRTSMLRADLHLKKTANHLVFGEGSPDAKVFFIGEAPGKNEDLQGLPFIGSAGRVLDGLLSSIDLKREDVFITSILKYRPPDNRNPKLEEIISHPPYLINQIRIVQPKIIVPLGNFATRFILGGFDIEKMSSIPGISQLHGKIEKVTFEKMSFMAIALYHPAAVLYNPPLRKTLEKDFGVIRQRINRFLSLIIFTLFFISPGAYAQEFDLYARAITAQQKGNLVEARHHLEEILSDPYDVPEIEIIEKTWGAVMWRIIRSDIQTPETLLYEVKAGDTLGKIAKAHGTTIELIKKRNKLKDSRIREGQTLTLWVVPLILEVDKEINRLNVYLNGRVVKAYAVSTGRSETTTPVGEFTIEYRYPDPTWFHHGEIVPPGSPKNFLGTRWLGFNKLKYGIHGTIYPELIGQSVSGGCVRMRNKDVEELYDIIPIGTKVSIY